MKSELSHSPTMAAPTSTGVSFFRYKFWALAAVLLLAFWSMFTGCLSLKSSAAQFARFYDAPRRNPIFHDLDILELEERERAVRHMWNLYTHGAAARLPRFWSEAFAAAYEDLIGDVPALRDAALLEIARMSLRSVSADPIAVPIKSKSGSRLRSSKSSQ